jgi:hypothetical protein
MTLSEATVPQNGQTMVIIPIEMVVGIRTFIAPGICSKQQEHNTEK